MMSIQSYLQFRECLARTRTEMRNFVLQYPDDRMLASIEKQLEAVDIWTHNDGVPISQEQLERLNFGLLASKAVEDLDETLADELHDMSSYVRKWNR